MLDKCNDVGILAVQSRQLGMSSARALETGGHRDCRTSPVPGPEQTSRKAVRD